MASILKVDTITGVATAGSIAVTGEGNSTTTNLQQGLAKSFGNIETGTTLVESFNQNSFTDVGVGVYTFNFTNSMADKNHVTTGNNMRNSNSGYGHTAALGNASDTSSTTTSATMVYTNVSNNTEDMRRCMAVTHGDLA
tara:strand:- start:1791 stop:2207 length:417 start_codon:yes stop_codon:yes gene_type:complete